MVGLVKIYTMSYITLPYGTKLFGDAGTTIISFTYAKGILTITSTIQINLEESDIPHVIEPTKDQPIPPGTMRIQLGGNVALPMRTQADVVATNNVILNYQPQITFEGEKRDHSILRALTQENN